MTALAWDQIGERRYETGVDHGVLYLSNGDGIPWNGLVSVTETKTREVKSYYLDGIKYLDQQIPGAYSAKMSAYTYPDELEEILGNAPYVPGVVLHDQRPRLFDLSYRTLEGNDTNGIDAGYKIHIVWNVMAVPSDVTFDTIGKDAAPGLFEWNLTAAPQKMFGVRPTSHMSLHSRHIDPDVLVAFEAVLYGTDEEDAKLPGPGTLLGMVSEP